MPSNLLKIVPVLFLFLVVQLSLAESLAPQYATTQCPHKPAGRLEEDEHRQMCPLPELLLGNSSWSYAPTCNYYETSPGITSEVHCLFTSTAFRNGHGVSLISTSTVASHLVGLDAFTDGPFFLRSALGKPYEIIDADGRGKGVVAKRTIRRGEILMVDYPALLIGIQFLQDTQPHHRRRLLRQAINQLPEDARARVFALSRGNAPHEMDAILGPNTHSVSAQVSPIQHPYRLNAYYRFSQPRLAMEVVAYHTIEAGEEVVISYAPLTTKRDARRQYLKANYGFDCDCPLCHAPELEIHDSEARRQRVVELYNTMTDAKSERYFQDAINIAEEWLQFAEWERIPPLYPEYHDILAGLYLGKGDIRNATRYARMALDGWARFGSDDDDELEKARLFLQNLTMTR
ncbi:hypothetical protein QBC46DRAFT_412553 [Diplogelasinospora grovesii]|uniref:SET domain-containing protein n=1 Tax=Diplogelasinospora grovesii TaxID=303347 RepID=A0AAN6N1Y0_9PEZI|nr:hypothetical protein QBC46DRAFT_412553 [Diplogelasinospora grovesii]